MSAKQLFKYQALDEAAHEIRILSLQPGAFDDPISCTISHEPLRSADDYEALSYCQGDPILCREISINEASFAVTKSAAYALRYLRTTDRVRRIWIDAVCTNQANPRERMHQVKQMKNIYQQALRVLACLARNLMGAMTALVF